MNTEIKGVHVEVDDQIRDFIAKKMQRLEFARDYIVDLLYSLSQEKNRVRAEVNINFRWGNSTHVGVAGFDIYEAIDKLADKMELKVIKEKKKIQEHKGQETVRTTQVAAEEA